MAKLEAKSAWILFQSFCSVSHSVHPTWSIQSEIQLKDGICYFRAAWSGFYFVFLIFEVAVLILECNRIVIGFVDNDWSFTMRSCCYSVTKSCPTLCDSMDGNTPGTSVLHYLPEFAQIHVHWVSDAIWSSYPLPPLSLFAFNLSQNLSLL